MLSLCAEAVVQILLGALWGLCYLTLIVGGTTIVLQLLVWVLVGIHYVGRFFGSKST